MINLIDLSGKKILVTGASSGIGRATAVLLSKLGASVVLVARNEMRLSLVLDELESGQHFYKCYDLSEISKIGLLMDDICSDGIKLDGLVHSAGVLLFRALNMCDNEILKNLMDINYFSFFELVKFFSKRKYSNDGSSIVALSSIAAYRSKRGMAIYSGSKGAIDSAIKGMALDLSPRRIRINSVAPGGIETDMIQQDGGIFEEKIHDTLKNAQPLGIGRPDDVAKSIAFLLSGASSFITGISLIVDGGACSQA